MRLCNHKSGELSWYSDCGTGWRGQVLWFDSEQGGDILPSSKAFRADVVLTQPPVHWVSGTIYPEGMGAGNVSDA
jgi:hypothetical protein